MSRKGEAKRRKTKILRNKKLIKRYPWIALVDWYGNKVNDYSYTMYDDVPIGWKRAFGKIMLEEYSFCNTRCAFEAMDINGFGKEEILKGTIQVIDRYSGGYVEIDILSGDIVMTSKGCYYIAYLSR